MCYVMYIASDNPLPMIPFDELNPLFCVEPLTEFEESARKQFSKLYVYHVGAHTHCGCGFSFRAAESWMEFDPEEQAAEETVRDSVPH